jgi:hypothetical protein
MRLTSDSLDVHGEGSAIKRAPRRQRPGLARPEECPAEIRWQQGQPPRGLQPHALTKAWHEESATPDKMAYQAFGKR